MKEQLELFGTHTGRVEKTEAERQDIAAKAMASIDGPTIAEVSIETTVSELIEHYRQSSGDKEPMVVIVGKDVSSNLLIKLRRIEGLEIRQERSDPRVHPVGYALNSQGKGPRGKWGKLK